MINGDRQSRSEHYREVADSLRRLSRETKSFDVRRDLVDLAHSFERMAEFTEKWEPTESEA